MGLEFLNQNSGAFAVIFSAVVAIATVVYAILTWQLVSETKRMREAQTEPKVSVSIQPREKDIGIIDMVIQNIGLGPAYNIKFEVNPDFEYAKGEFLSKLGFMENGLRYLAPNQKLQFLLTNMHENFEEKIKESFEIRVTYQNSIGKGYKDIYTIDFTHLIGLRIGLIQVSGSDLHKIARSIEEIQKHLRDLLKIIVSRYTKKDVEEEIKQPLERDNQPKKEDEK